MGKKILTRLDATHENGFPANIDFNFPVVVQVALRPTQSIVLYTCKETGKPTRSYFAFEFSDKYLSGIFEL